MRKVLDILSSVAVVVLCGFGVYNFIQGPANGGGTARPKAEVPKEPVSLAGTAILGSSTADVGLIVFTDFECPVCGKFAKTILPELETKYIKKGKLQLAYMHYPLEQIHKQALPTAISAVCAAAQGKFREVHDGFFADQAILQADWQSGFAEKYSLDSKQYKICVNSPETELRVRNDIALGKKYAITGTPTTFVGKVVNGSLQVSTVISGFGPINEFTKPIDSLLK